MKRLAAAALLLVAACASSPSGEGWTATTNATRVPLENNRQGWLIECSRYQAECLKRAQAVCPAGYALVQQDERSTGAVLLPAGAGAIIAPTSTITMIVACSPSAG